MQIDNLPTCINYAIVFFNTVRITAKHTEMAKAALPRTDFTDSMTIFVVVLLTGFCFSVLFLRLKTW